MSDVVLWVVERVAAWIPLVLSLTVHEWAHAWVARRLGDPTAEAEGRLSLDPLVHLDPVGSVLLPLIGAPLGWARPVPVNPVHFRLADGRWGMLLAAAAGPAANLALALLGALALGLLDLVGLAGGGLGATLLAAVGLNLMLTLFNLLPIPPLDGSRIVDWLCPDALRPWWEAVERGGVVVLILVLVAARCAGADPGAWLADILAFLPGAPR